MSKIGKKLIQINTEVSIKETDEGIEVSGPRGSLIVPFDFPVFQLEKNENGIKVVPKKKNLTPKEKSLWGTTRALLFNAVKGVTDGWEMKIILEGLGYTAEVQGQKIVFRIGYSRPVEIEVPTGIEVEIQSERSKSFIILKGIDKQKLGQFGDQIIHLRKRDSYKGKGFRWADEELRLKPIKKAVGV